MSYINTLTISQLYSLIDDSRTFNYFSIKPYDGSVGLITEVGKRSSKRSYFWDTLTWYKKERKYNRVFIYL